jgi:hypothetical protein
MWISVVGIGTQLFIEFGIVSEFVAIQLHTESWAIWHSDFASAILQLATLIFAFYMQNTYIL